MELNDICDGCSKHPAFCMCGVSIGPEGVVHSRPQPATLADKFRIITNDARRKNKETEESQTPIARCRWRVLQAAKQGQFSTAIWMYGLHLSKEGMEALAVELRSDGFKCEVIDPDFLHLYWE